MIESLSELRDALSALGASTSTGPARGDERRAILQQRLRETELQLGIGPQNTKPTTVSTKARHNSEEENKKIVIYREMSLSELRGELEARGLSTQTLGLKGEARRHALVQRLQNSGSDGQSVCGDGHNLANRTNESAVIDDGAKSSRSSTSSYSAVGDFLFFDPLPAQQARLSTQVNSVLALQLQAHESADHQTKGSDRSNDTQSPRIRAELERELIGLRNQLHEERRRQSQETSRRLHDAGFHQSFDGLSSSMMKLESERQRVMRVAFGHELVTTTVLSTQPLELVREDAVRLIEQHQENLRSQIQRLKLAIELTTSLDQESNRARFAVEANLETSIRRVESQLCLYHPTTRISLTGTDSSARSNISSTSPSSAASEFALHETPVLTRCRSLPHHMFHDTWRELQEPDKQQLQHELQAAKSFRIRRDRVCVHDKPTTTSRPPENRPNVRGFTRYPPTPADKLAVKALFMEQSQRSPVEIQRVYKQALELEPANALVLGNFARFLDEKCKTLDEAELVFGQAIRADPSSASNLAAYALFLHKVRQDHAGAEDLYLQALRLEPGDPVVLGHYARLLRKRANGRDSQLVQAKELLTQALTVDKGHIGNHLQLCSVLDQLGDVKAAWRCYEQLVAMLELPLVSAFAKPNNQSGHESFAGHGQIAHVYGNFANFLKRVGEFEKAKNLYEAATRLQPTDALLHRN